MLAVVRTTVDIPPDLHALATELARSSRRTFSQTVVALLREALDEPGTVALQQDPVTGLQTLATGRPLTSDDVSDLLDDA